jgi:glycerol-3-phosphate dehydrogenase (NAD(P)+)
MATPARPAVAVIGAGAWGTALAAAASSQADVVLWGRDPQAMTAMSRTGVNSKYLPGIALPQTLAYTSDLSSALTHLKPTPAHSLLVLATPMAGLPQICQEIGQHLKAGLQIAGLVWTCKGLTPEDGHLPHEVVAQTLAHRPTLPTGVLSGPSFAKEVAQGLPVALTVASEHDALRALVTQSFHSDRMRIYSATDVLGVEIGGALKNIMATACGISDGLGLGENARAALITRGLAEMTRFGVALGALPATFSGLTGLGDLVLTATGQLSRNRQVGLRIGHGEQLQDILADGLTAEGARCAKAVLVRAHTKNIPMPITQAVCDTLFNDVPPMEAVSQLMARSATQE